MIFTIKEMDVKHLMFLLFNTDGTASDSAPPTVSRIQFSP